MTEMIEPRRRRRWVGFAVWTGTGGLVLWTVMRLFGWDTWYPATQLLAFTPYVAALGPLVALAAGLTRRWWALGPAVAAVLALAVVVLPRGFGGPEEGPGAELTVMSSNLLAGAADFAGVVAFARDAKADVIAFQEYTPESEVGLAAAGLLAQLPYRYGEARPGTEGSALYSRYPLRDGAIRINFGNFRQARATFDVPGAGPVTVESVHPAAPYDFTSTRNWNRSLAGQPAASGDGPMWILAGDFNSTLDHSGLRTLLATGYRDAASVVGAGFIATWPYDDDGGWIPGVTLDHILADQRIRIRNFGAATIAGTDHRAIAATLVVPAPDRRPT